MPPILALACIVTFCSVEASQHSVLAAESDITRAADADSEQPTAASTEFPSTNMLFHPADELSDCECLCMLSGYHLRRVYNALRLLAVHYATAFLELAERARAHADALVDRGLKSASSASASSTSDSTSEAERAAQLRSAAAAAAEASWRFGGRYSPQQFGQWRMQDGSWNFGNDRRIEVREAPSHDRHRHAF
jgi:hypothetical protein